VRLASGDFEVSEFAVVAELTPPMRIDFTSMIGNFGRNMT